MLANFVLYKCKDGDVQEACSRYSTNKYVQRCHNIVDWQTIDRCEVVNIEVDTKPQHFRKLMQNLACAKRQCQPGIQDFEVLDKTAKL